MACHAAIIRDILRQSMRMKEPSSSHILLDWSNPLKRKNYVLRQISVKFKFLVLMEQKLQLTNWCREYTVRV